MIAAMVFGLNSGTRVGNRYTPLLDAIFHVKLNVTTAHLWFEEAVSGDQHESIEDVRAYLDQAEGFVEFALAGQQIDDLPLVLLTEPSLRAAFVTLQGRLERLSQVTEERWQLSQEARAGTAIDEDYDRLFRALIALCDEMEAGLEWSIASETEQFRRVQGALIVASVVLFALTLLMARSHVRALREEIAQRELTEQSLKRSESEAVAAKEEADAANHAKSLFLAKISHEIRTPISAIMGMSTMLSESTLDAEQREYTRIVQTSSNDLLEIINDLLDFSKIEAGRLNLAPVAFDLRKTVADVADLMNLKALKKDVLLCADIEPGFPVQVEGDPVRIRQILLNLTRNAIKFTEQGRIVLGLAARSERAGVVQVRLTVTDTGIGIPVNKLEHIFDAFTQVDDSSTRQYGGTGLGLSICRQLTELMRGQMGVDSETGEGARFWVDLPLTLVRRDEPPEPLLVDGRPARVLVADPCAENAACTGRFVSRAGAGVEIVNDAERVLESLYQAVLAGEPYNAIIVSEPFQGLDLGELARILRADPGLRQLGILVLVSGPTPGLARQYAGTGINAIATQAQRALVLQGMLTAALADRGPPSGELAFANAPDAEGELAGRPRAPRYKARVLLVEDNPVTQWAAKHMLSTMGCRVDVADNGEQALASWKNKPYDLIFMDWQMPDMDGIDVTTRIRAMEPAGTHTPIVALTANAMTGDRETCLNAGMDEYLSKPVQQDALERVLATFLSTRESQRSVSA